MNQEEFGQQLRRVGDLFESGDYTEALSILDRLARELPDSRRVAYARALCLLGLKQFDAAEEVCAKLVGRFPDGRAEKLLARIRDLRPKPVAHETPSSDASPSEEPASEPPQFHLGELTSAPLSPSSSAKERTSIPNGRRARLGSRPLWAALSVLIVAAAGAGLFFALKRRQMPEFRHYEAAAARLILDYPADWTLKESGGAPSLLFLPAIGSFILSSEPELPEFPEFSFSSKGKLGGPAESKSERRGEWNLKGLFLTISSHRLPQGPGVKIDADMILKVERQASGAKPPANAPAGGANFGAIDMLEAGEVALAPETFDLNGRMAARFVLRGKMADGKPMTLRQTDVFDPSGILVSTTAYYPKGREKELEPLLEKVFASLAVLAASTPANQAALPVQPASDGAAPGRPGSPASSAAPAAETAARALEAYVMKRDLFEYLWTGEISLTEEGAEFKVLDARASAQAAKLLGKIHVNSSKEEPWLVKLSIKRLSTDPLWTFSYPALSYPAMADKTPKKQFGSLVDFDHPTRASRFLDHEEVAPGQAVERWVLYPVPLSEKLSRRYVLPMLTPSGAGGTRTWRLPALPARTHLEVLEVLRFQEAQQKAAFVSTQGASPVLVHARVRRLTPDEDWSFSGPILLYQGMRQAPQGFADFERQTYSQASTLQGRDVPPGGTVERWLLYSVARAGDEPFTLVSSLSSGEETWGLPLDPPAQPKATDATPAGPAGRSADVARADALVARAAELWQAGDTKGAIEAATQALEIKRAALGPDHPEVGKINDMIENARAKPPQ